MVHPQSSPTGECASHREASSADLLVHERLGSARNDETQIARRLQKVTVSIESFFASQVERLQQALDRCQAQVEEGKLVQRILADLETQKQEWENKRQAEIHRLHHAGEQLAEGWKALENERRQWLATRESGQINPPTDVSESVVSEHLVQEPRHGQHELPTTNAKPAELDLSQLQRLRQEMEQHSRRKR